MNNKIFKDYLAHAWVNTSPEEISNYNRAYYKQHALDWVKRKEKRKNVTLASAVDSVPKVLNTASSGSSGWKGPDLQYGGEVLYDIVSAGSSFVKAIINTGKDIIDWRKDVHIRRQDRGSTIGGMIKAGLNWLKKNLGI